MIREPLLMLCGIGSDADSWRDQADALGGTAMVAEGATIEAMAAQILAAAPQRFALAGQSMGGYVALAMARAAPERITRLALINSSAAPDTEAQRDNRRRIIATIAAKGLGPLLDLLPPLLTDDPDVQGRVAAMLLRAGPDRVMREYRACADRPDSRSALPSITLPTLIVETADDIIIPKGAGSDMAHLLSGAEHVTLPDGGHASPMTRPKQVTEILRQWLNRPLDI